MKAGIIFTGTGPILVLTTYPSFKEPPLVQKLAAKGIKKFVVCELPVVLVKERYGNHYDVIVNDIKQTDDLRVLDYNGHSVYNNFSFKEMGQPIYYEPDK